MKLRKIEEQSLKVANPHPTSHSNFQRTPPHRPYPSENL